MRRARGARHIVVQQARADARRSKRRFRNHVHAPNLAASRRSIRAPPGRGSMSGRRRSSFAALQARPPSRCPDGALRIDWRDAVARRPRPPMRRQVASARRSSGARHSEAFLFGRASAVVVIAGTRPSPSGLRTPLFLSSWKAPFRFRCETSNFITHRNTGWIFIGSWDENTETNYERNFRLPLH